MIEVFEVNDMVKWFLLFLSMVHQAQTARLDDMAVNQAQQFDSPDTAVSVDSHQHIVAGSDFVKYRYIRVEGGVNGQPGTFTSAQVAGDTLTLSFGYDGTVSNQFVIVAWRESDVGTIWNTPLDFAEFDALQLDVGLVTQPVRLTLSLRDKVNMNQQSVQMEIDQFGLYRFEFDDFDQIDFSQIDLIGIQFFRGTGSNSATAMNINSIELINDDVVFANGFEAQ